MEFQTITISLSRKINTGNYESAEATAFLSAHIDQGDSIDKVQEYLIAECNNALDKALRPYRENAIAGIAEYFMGKKVEEDDF